MDHARAIINLPICKLQSYDFSGWSFSIEIYAIKLLKVKSKLRYNKIRREYLRCFPEDVWNILG